MPTLTFRITNIVTGVSGELSSALAVPSRASLPQVHWSRREPLPEGSPADTETSEMEADHNHADSC